MELKELFADDDAVSSVVSTILMVAITIILVAVIGSFVLNLGGAVGETVPQARLAVVEKSLDANNSSVTIVHEGGQTLQEQQVSVKVNGQQALVEGPANNFSAAWGGKGELTAGSTVNVTHYRSSGVGQKPLQTNDRVIVVWESKSGATSSTLFTRTVQG
jgi:FlaG/FlaF family flagellin (archaellin)